MRAAVRPWCPEKSMALLLCLSLTPLTLVLTAGSLMLNLPRALLVRAVADRALVDLHLSACWYHCCVCVAVRPCNVGYGRSRKSGSELEMILIMCFQKVKSNWPYVCCQHHVTWWNSDCKNTLNQTCQSQGPRVTSGLASNYIRPMRYILCLLLMTTC